MTSPLRDKYRGFRVNATDLYHWNQLLEEWILVIERFSRVTGGGDSAFGQGERPNVGFLAAAAWRCGFVAVNEFDHEKRDEDDKRQGRADLLLYVGEQTHIVKAKFRWIPLTPKFGIQLATLAATASNDAYDSFSDEDHDAGLGIAFGATFVENAKSIDVDKLIEVAVNQVWEMKVDFLAYCFPSQERACLIDGKNLTPGVVIVGLKHRAPASRGDA